MIDINKIEFIITFSQRPMLISPALEEALPKLSRAINHFFNGDERRENLVRRVKFKVLQKYIRMDVMYMGEVHGSSYAFLDAKGNIYKPDGFKKPAKHIRGNIFEDENFSIGKAFGLYGVAYLR